MPSRVVVNCLDVDVLGGDACYVGSKVKSDPEIDPIGVTMVSGNKRRKAFCCIMVPSRNVSRKTIT